MKITGIKMDQHFREGFEKIAKKKAKKKDQGAIVPIAELGVGGAALHLSKNRVLGKYRYYHGTNSKNYKKIMKEGLSPAKGGIGGAGEAVGSQSFMEQSKGKVHLTPSKTVARSFTKPEHYSKLEKNPGKLLTHSLNPFNNKNIVKMDLPYHMEKTLEADPHMSSAIAKTSKDPVKLNRIVGQKGYLKKYIKDLKHLPNYVKNKPGRFGVGIGLAGIGGTLAVDGYKKLRSNHAKRKNT